MIKTIIGFRMWSRSLCNLYIHNHFVWTLSHIWCISLNFPLLWPFFLDLQTCSSFLCLEKIFKLFFIFLHSSVVLWESPLCSLSPLLYFSLSPQHLLTGYGSHYLSPVQNPQFSSYSAFTEHLLWLVGSWAARDSSHLILGLCKSEFAFLL